MQHLQPEILQRLNALGTADQAALLDWLRARQERPAIPSPPVPPANGAVLLHTEGLTKTFRRGFTLQPLSLTVQAGQVWGVLGPNGSGKSTFFRMLTGLLAPTGGQVTLFGSTDPDVYRPRMGVAPENYGFDLQLSGYRNLRLAALAKGLPPDAGMAPADALELTGALSRAVKGYSFGMRKRLATACALMGNPDLLLLDEPANGLDALGILTLRRTLATFANEGRAVIFSSHIVEEMERLCTHLLVIHKGALRVAGPIGEVLPTGTSLEEFYLNLIQKPV